MNSDHVVLENFSGLARLFPLPNVVLFPHVLQALHIFEPRYRQMTADALDGDRLIALTLLQPGWEADYEGRPAIHPVVCLGRILTEQRLADGRFNLLVRGLIRARIEEEIATDRLYRQARLQLVADFGQPCGPAASQLRRELAHRAVPWFTPQGPARDQLHNLIHSDRPLGVVCDILSYALPLVFDMKQRLLAEAHVERRAQALIQYLERTPTPSCAKAAAARKYPPGFSSN